MITPRSLVLLLSLMAACARNPGEVVVRRSQPHMGTVVTLTVAIDDEAVAERAIASGFAEVSRLDQLLSNYKSTSDLSRLNAQAGTGPVSVAPELFEVTRAAVQIATRSGGAFNPLLQPVIKLWGIPEHPRVPSAAELEALRPLTDLRGLVLSEDQRTIALAQPGMALGLGGVGKGYTADRVAEVLEQSGARGGVAAIGGDIRVFGKHPDDRPWRIAVRPPQADTPPLAVVELSRGAVSTSGDYERYFEVDGVRYHHIIDPRSLMPAQGAASVTVLAPTATEADGLATAVLVMSPAEGVALVERSAHSAALILDQDRRRLASSRWPAGVESDAKFDLRDGENAY
ncbi:MAG: FAD:protein FMN transferase [Deltaproteobacteria bacterium]|nr:FAD:protein FMN transferase [Deltaproteobacteria bacterium]